MRKILKVYHDRTEGGMIRIELHQKNFGRMIWFCQDDMARWVDGLTSATVPLCIYENIFLF